MRNKLRNFGLVGTGIVVGILISLNFSAVGKDDGAGTLPVEELRSFADVFNAVKQGYVEPVEDKKLITNAISGMLSNLDPHSTYLDPDAFKELQVSTQGEFGGLGIEVGMEDGFVKVVSPIEDTPAYKAGIKSGDFIVKLDDTPVQGMTLNEVVKRMRGKPKTTLRLTVVRKGEPKPIEFSIVRDKIKVQSVKSKLLESGYGYVRVTQFQEETTTDLIKALDKLYKDKQNGDQGLRGLVLDLRNDPGGLLNSAVGVSAAFLPPKALVVSTDGRTDDARRKYFAVPDDYLRGSRDDYIRNVPASIKTVPMVVLVNGGSASASEIVAGALQDHKRAVVMGTQSFGKGSVQTILPLNSNAAIKLTTARYFTPSGRSIQAKGIVPDIVVEETPNGSRERLREADLDRHLVNAGEPDAPKSETPASRKDPAGKPRDKDNRDNKDKPKDEADEVKPAFEIAGKDDYQLAQAVNLLKGLQILQNSAK